MRVVAVPDCGRSIGVGHVMRCLGLAEELRLRGHEVVFLADLDGIDWVAAQLGAAGIDVASGPRDAQAILALQPDAVVIDSYTLPPATSAQLQDAGVPVLAFADGDTRGQSADIYVDQNLGAEPAGGWLAGLDFVILRDAIRRHRPQSPDRPDAQSPVVLAYFGGTDVVGAAPLVARALAASDAPYRATFIAADATLASGVRAADRAIEVLSPTDRLPELAAAADLVICAAGTSLWEMLSLGATVAAVCVADNQEDAYRRVVADATIAGLGLIDEIRAAPASAAAVLHQLLTDPGVRAKLRTASWGLVDGAGRIRVADAIERLVLGSQSRLRSDPS
jgi:spore coat polysaccharide biosynthesis predicted glycosyltransferase SpsG